MTAMNTGTLAVIGVSSLAAIALAAAPLAGLKVGSKAPALSLESFVQGEEVKEFQAGTPYVIEFWATWCPPCVASVPHLNQLQKEHPEVVFIGVAGSQREETPEAKAAKVKSFVESRGENMTYRVAMDNDGSMSKEWMQAAQMQGIPCAFVVDGKGKVTFIGHPQDKGFESAVEKAAKGAKKKPAKKPADDAGDDKPADGDDAAPAGGTTDKKPG